MLDLISRAPVEQQVTDALRQMLRRGAYEVGETLPTATELAVALAVNPQAMKQAYETLSREGLLRLEEARAEVLPMPDETERLLEHWDAATVQLLDAGYPKQSLEQRLKEASV